MVSRIPATRGTATATDTAVANMSTATATSVNESAEVDEATLIAHVRLASQTRIGSRIRARLLEHFGSPQAVFHASAAELADIERLGRRTAEGLLNSDEAEAARLLETCRREGVRILLDTDPDYPPLLSRIADPPGLLFVRGSLLPCDALSVAVVGARHATAYGIKVAEQLAAALARAGYTVTSGLARGIDSAAHRGALAAGGRTLAILGSGVLEVYPPEHLPLAEEVEAAGAVISEPPPFAKPAAGAFPQRNRIISGLSLGVVVVQAAERSGAMITARLAGDQGREVFAVPGPIDCRMSKGCHRLIQDGAKLVGGIDDILEELGPLFETAVTPDGRRIGSPGELALDEAERQVLDAIPQAAEGMLLDSLIVASGLEVSQVLAIVSVLETRRLVKRLPGSRIARR
jgi:DNA processing protein